MSTPHTRDQFLELIVQSGLLPQDVLRACPRTLGEGPDGARVVADRLIKDRLLTPFQVRQLLQGKSRGFFLADKYKVLALLSQGSAGPVVLTENLREQKLVAAKLLQKLGGEEAAPRRAALQRFIRETREAGILDHPNIVRIQDMDRNGSTPFLTSDYVDGSSLQEIVTQLGPMALPRAIDYIRQAAFGLHHIHANNLLHRDIKPNHLLLDRKGVVRLIDVGLAEFLGHSGAREGSSGDSASSDHGYLSPEFKAGGTPDARSDVYSLGAALHFLLSGRAPSGADPSGPRGLADVRELRPDVPAGLAEIIGRMTATSPGDRYPAMKAVVAAISPWLREAVPPPSSDEMPSAPPSAYRLGLVASPGLSPGGASGTLADGRWGFAGAPDGDSSARGSRTMEPLAYVNRPLDNRDYEPRPAPSGEHGALGRSGEATVATSLIPTPAAIADPPERPMPIGSGSGVVPVPSQPVAPAVAPTVAQPVVAPAPATAPAAPAGPKPKHRGSPRVLLGVVGIAVLATGGTIWWLNYSSAATHTTQANKPLFYPPPSPPNNTPPNNTPSSVNPGTQSPMTNPPVTPSANVPPNTGVPAASHVLLTGSGSTFIKPAMEYWTRLYEQKTGVKIKYDGIGSGRGVDNMIDKVLDFGCTDAFMSEAQLKKARAANGEVLHIPLAMGAVVVTYNLPGVKQQLRFTGPVLADIYLGKITHWDHEAIAASNPGVTLPHAPITVIRRSDSSGTTFIWTDYLSKVSPDWEKTVGRGTTVKWPVGEDAEKSDGAAKAVSRTSGSISYVELSFALERNLGFGQVKNAGDKYVAPTLESVTAAANASLQSIPSDLRYSLTDPPGDDSYPIAGTTWLVLYLNQPGVKGKEMVKFLRWMVHEGQDYLRDLRYARLPPRLAARIDDQLKSVQTEE